MGSAKTLKLLTMAYNFEENGIPFMVLKPEIDTRDGEAVISSRVGLQRECATVSPIDDIFAAVSAYNNMMLSTLSKLEWILVDECQFLTEKQIDQLARIVDELEIDVMCFGLRADFESKVFPGSKRLFEIADTIEEVKCRCSCGRKAIVNARFDENKQIVTSGEQIMVGGNDIYKPLCRKCWNKLVSEKNNLK
jgi:thymidine kinase